MGLYYQCAYITTTRVTCFGLCDGTAKATPTFGAPPFSYLWLPGGQTTDSILNLCAGNYTLISTDSAGIVDTFYFPINEPAVLTTSVISIDAICFGGNNGTVQLNVNGGTPPYTYNWSTEDLTENITSLPSGVYYVNVSSI